MEWDFKGLLDFMGFYGVSEDLKLINNKIIKFRGI